MKAQVSKWGNSLAILLPEAVAATLHVHQGQAVDLIIEGDAVVMRASRPRYRRCWVSSSDSTSRILRSPNSRPSGLNHSALV